MRSAFSCIGMICVLSRFFLAIFSSSGIVWLIDLILKFCFPSFHKNSLLWIKCHIINCHHGLSILSISKNNWSKSIICSSTKKLNIKSKELLSKMRGFSRSQIVFLMFHLWFFSILDDISSAVYDLNLMSLCCKRLYILPSHAHISKISNSEVSVGNKFKKNHLSKLFKCLW